MKLMYLSCPSVFCMGIALGSLVCDSPALGQTNSPPASTNSPPASSPTSTNVTELETVNVVGHLNEARSQILPSLGATAFTMSETQITAEAQGDNAPMNQVILRAPGVAEDSAENGDLHVRGEHANLQYRIDGVLLPEGIAGFGLELDPRFVQSMQLIDGSLPAQYGFRTAGIVNIQTKSGAYEPGGEVGFYGGSYDTFRPYFELGGKEGKFNFFIDGSYDHNELGIENPTGSSTAIHDETEQFKTFMYGSYIMDPSSRLSFMASASYSDFQVPNTPGVVVTNWVPALQANGLLPSGYFNSADDNENQNEQNYYTAVTYQKSAGDLDYQISVVGRESEQHFTPDPIGDLYLNGVASEVHRYLYSTGLQADGSYQLGDSHTIRAGGIFLAEGTQNNSSTEAFNTSTLAPVNIVDDHPLYGLFAGLYVQDEWKLTSQLTLNYGARFDVFSSSFDDENQVSPRVNLIYKPARWTTLHAGYSRFFTPPPIEDVGGGSVAKSDGTSNASATDQDDPVKAERANYYDAGITQTILPGWSAGLDGYYKTAQQQLDDGLFGQTLILSAFNYEKGRVYGLEFTTSYETNGFNVYANAAYSVAQGENWDSAEFLFDPADIAYVQHHFIYLDHDQTYTGTAGVSYRVKESREASTMGYMDIVAGSGLRQDATAADGSNIPNGASVPDYYSLNVGLEQTFQVAHKQLLKARLDIVNVTDNTYELRSGTGVGVNAAQYGMRRGIFGSLSYRF
ncbi:MAG: TonB-dependent receptor [Limisphaerales bacterium]